MKTTGAEFVVVGAGVFGVWIAYELRRRGHAVILLDAYGAGNNRSSSGDESRIIRMGYGADQLYTRWAAHSLTRWQELFETGKQALFVNTGVLWLSTASDDYTRQLPSVLAANSVAYEKLSATELAARFPQIAVDDVDFAVLEPQSGVLLARRAVQAVLEEAIRAGAQYAIEAVIPPAEHGKENGGRIGQLSSRSGTVIEGDVFIFACGAWLPQLFPSVIGSRLFPTRQEVFYFGAPAGSRLFKPPAMPVWLHHADEMYGLPDIENRGIKIACDRHGDAFNPELGERLVTAAGERSIRDYLRRRLPQLENAPLTETRVCQYENTSNGDFLIDRHPAIENLWLVGGGSGHGFKHGPAVGGYVASAILDNAKQQERFLLSHKLQVQQRSVY